MADHHFVSYSSADGAEFVARLAAELTKLDPSIVLWRDRDEIHGGQDWAEVLEAGIEGCATVIFVMTRDSVMVNSVCRNEITHALDHRRPIIPVRAQAGVKLPLRINSLDFIAFDDFEAGVKDLRATLAFRTTPKGVLHSLKDARNDAERRKARARGPAERSAIEQELEEIAAEIEAQRRVVDKLAPRARPRTPKDQAATALEAEVPLWIERILTAQDLDGGGIRGQMYDPTSPPQTWTTAQSLAGMLATPHVEGYREEIRSAFDFIERNRQEGERDGWSLFDDGEESVTEIGCWVALAKLRGLAAGSIWSGAEAAEVASALRRDLAWIVARQHASGGWCPTRHLTRRNTRTYSTMMALWSLIEADRTPAVATDRRQRAAVNNGLRWLLNERSDEFGWVANPNRRMQRDACLGLEAQALAILLYAKRTQDGDRPSVLSSDQVLERAGKEFLECEDFASRRLFLNDALADADQQLQETRYRLEGSSFLWAPWSVVALGELAHSPDATGAARDAMLGLMARIYDRREKLGFPGTYELAEFLFGISQALYEPQP